MVFAGANFKQYMLETSMVSLAEDTWMVCYGRGVVPTASLYLHSGSLLSLDLASPFKMALTYWKVRCFFVQLIFAG